MIKTLILIGLLDLKNNRTIREPKNLQGGQERQLSPHAYFQEVTDGTGNWRGLLLGQVWVSQESIG